MNGITSTTALWYASRATGVVSLLLLSAVMILGMVVNRQGRLPGLPRFGATSLHRSVSLLAVLFVAVHVITAIADPFVTIRIAAAVVPFTSGYEPFWLGLGAVSLDLIIALVVTSLARARIGRRAWRSLHWLAYAAWPVAFAHSIGSSTDLQSGGLRTLAIGCALAVTAAAGWRVSHSIGARRRSERAASALGQPSPASASGAAHHDAAHHGAAHHVQQPLVKAGRS
jgi:methionine sulfoxide reductase heme-binding subunit